MTTAYDFEPLPPELDCLAIDPAPLTPSEDELLRMYRAMRLARIFETRLAALYRQGKIIGAVYLGTGQEAIATGVASLMDKKDIFNTVSRNLAAWFYRGVEPKHVVARWFGKDIAPSHGRDLGLFLADLDNNGGLDLVGSGPTGTQVWLSDEGGGLRPHASPDLETFTVADVSSDGRRFLMLKPAPGTGDQNEATPRITVVLNWFDELKRLVPIP